jgi:alanyl-tRNA synthetase
LRKKAEEILKEKMQLIKKHVIEAKQTLNGIDLFTLRGPFPADAVKDMAFQIRGEFPEKSCFAAATESDGKPLLTLMISDDLVKDGAHAGQIVRNAAKHIQGGGGGQAYFATAGGKNAEGLSIALKEIKKEISNQ